MIPSQRIQLLEGHHINMLESPIPFRSSCFCPFSLDKKKTASGLLYCSSQVNRLGIGNGDRKHLNLCFLMQWSLQGTGNYTKRALLICSVGLYIREITSRKEISASSPLTFSVKSIFGNLFKVKYREIVQVCSGIFVVTPFSRYLSTVENPGLLDSEAQVLCKQDMFFQ